MLLYLNKYYEYIVALLVAEGGVNKHLMCAFALVKSVFMLKSWDIQCVEALKNKIS